MIRALAALLIAASATCGAKPDPFPLDLPRLDAGAADAGPDCSACAGWGAVEIAGPLPSVLDGLSGLAPSVSNPGVIYAHNDSGDGARLFALTPHGQLLAELRLSGADAVDWEDMAVGPCEGGGSCIYLADTGDDLFQRGRYTVYRAREPTLTFEALSSGVLELDLEFDRLPFIYPGDGRLNAETLLVHPRTGDIYVVTQEPSGTPSRVFRFPRPFTAGQTTTLIDLGLASVPTRSDALLTSGAIHPCGDALLLRMSNRSVELRPVGDAGFESAFHAEPRETPSPIDEPQGEAISWGRDGQSYFTAGEGTAQSLHRVRCLP